MDDAVSRRVQAGRQARERVPRSAHREVFVNTRRQDPVEIIQEQAQTRVPALVPIRHGRMAASPFAFFRGAAAVMAADLADTPVSGLTVQLCGDAHAANFGLFASPERRLVFDVNDFDETLAGPWEWDLKRLVASLNIAGRERGFKRQELRLITATASARYRQAMTNFARLRNLEVWYATYQADSELLAARRSLDGSSKKLVSKAILKAKSRDHIQTYATMIHQRGDKVAFIDDPPLLVRLENLVEASDTDTTMTQLEQAFADYRGSLGSDLRLLLDQYRPVDIARKVVGVGSVGTQAWVMLLLGRDRNDPLFLQIKQAQRSVLERYLATSPYRNSGHRVVVGQRAMQASSDILLGWNRMTYPDETHVDYYVRQLRDWKGSFDIGQMAPSSMARYGELCAWTLARAHARSGDRVAIAAYLGKKDTFDLAMVDFADAYADQNQRDYDSFLAALADGRVGM